MAVGALDFGKNREYAVDFLAALLSVEFQSQRFVHRSDLLLPDVTLYNYTVPPENFYEFPYSVAPPIPDERVRLVHDEIMPNARWQGSWSMAMRTSMGDVLLRFMDGESTTDELVRGLENAWDMMKLG